MVSHYIKRLPRTTGPDGLDESWDISYTYSDCGSRSLGSISYLHDVPFEYDVYGRSIQILKESLHKRTIILRQHRVGRGSG